MLSTQRTSGDAGPSLCFVLVLRLACTVLGCPCAHCHFRRMFEFCFHQKSELGAQRSGSDAGALHAVPCRCCDCIYRLAPLRAVSPDLAHVTFRVGTPA